MTPPQWASRALTRMLERVAVTRDEVGSRYPLFADPDIGRWTTSRRGSWTGGFWAGLLWLRARHTGDQADRTAASECTERLAGRLTDDTATRGLIAWYGTALAVDDNRADELREQAGRACLDAMDPKLGLVPWGSAFGGPRLMARADGVPGMVPLLASLGPRGGAAAASHLHRHLELCLADEPLRPAWRYEGAVGWQACDDPPPGWSRGVAWLLLAVGDGLIRLDGTGGGSRRLHAAADRLSAEWIQRTEESLVPAAEPGRSGSPLDTSAAAIAAVALLKLALVQGHSELREHAVRILNTLARGHLTGHGEGRPAGMLLDGCYDAAASRAVQHELVWGDFALALGLAHITGLADVRDV